MSEIESNHWQVERLWPDPHTGPFRLRLKFGQVAGREAITAVELRGVAPEKPWPTEFPELPDAAVQAEDIRLPLGALLDAQRMLHGSRARAARALWPENEANVQQYEQQHDVKPRGRPRTSEAFLRQVADLYREAEVSGDRAPALLIAGELNARTVNTARGWIRQARKRGLLAPVKQRSDAADS